jgi:hypothetical protein
VASTLVAEAAVVGSLGMASGAGMVFSSLVSSVVEGSSFGSVAGTVAWEIVEVPAGTEVVLVEIVGAGLAGIGEGLAGIVVVPGIEVVAFVG